MFIINTFHGRVLIIIRPVWPVVVEHNWPHGTGHKILQDARFNHQEI
jgi:hypothetical protein